jgi:hypothetical protein
MQKRFSLPIQLDRHNSLSHLWFQYHRRPTLAVWAFQVDTPMLGSESTVRSNDEGQRRCGSSMLQPPALIPDMWASSFLSLSR